MGTDSPRRVVEESLGEAVVRGIDDFVFRDIETLEEATGVFAFVLDPEVRSTLGVSLRGVRWQQKVRYVLARDRDHPAYGVLIRSQMIEYGAITELSLREAVRQERPAGLPKTFHGLIERAKALTILDDRSVAAAQRLREARNRVHLDPSAGSTKIGDSAKALKDFVVVVNQCRTHSGLALWQPTRPTGASR
jgi:hypothetical protein